MDKAGRSRELNIDALPDNLETVISMIDEILSEADVSPKVQMPVELAVEEIFVNIAHYAYPEGTGQVGVRACVSEDGKVFSVSFTDSGVPYNPLAREDPDVTLSAEERKIGGLGVFLTKKLMDDVRYEYRDGQNILELFKNLT